MKKHIGSTLALVLAVISLAAGVSQPSMLVAGIVILLGALAYRSAKKRSLGEVPNSNLRRSVEAVAVALAVAAVALQANVRELIVADPVPNFLVPVWVVVAYLVVALRKPSSVSDEV